MSPETAIPAVDMKDPICWSNEDGDHWTIRGHLSADAARARVLECELYWSGQEHVDEFVREGLDTAEITRGFVIDCEWDEERLHIVDALSPNSYPVTWVAL